MAVENQRNNPSKQCLLPQGIVKAILIATKDFCFCALMCLFLLPSSGSIFGQQQPDQSQISAPKRAGDATADSHQTTWSEDSFWAKRLNACRNGSMPTIGQFMLGTDKSQFVHNFLVASGKVNGRHRGPKWNDGDTYKWLEAVTLIYSQTRDPELLATLDNVIASIASAQRQDGYLHTPVLIAERNGLSDGKAFADPVNFEMYNMGHLMTAACVHFEITGDQRLLEVACKAADFLNRAFEQPTPEMARHAVCPSHYMGIIDLFRVTRDDRYLNLARRWMAMRDLVQGGDDNQDRIPFFQQREAVGHAVRANYLYAGAADLYLETKEPLLLQSLKACWDSVQQKKIYVTGGCGALYDGASPDGTDQQSIITRVHQAYGRNYQLPNSTAHNETCAAIGNVLWNERMWKITEEPKYIDALENSLFNAVLSGVSLDGTKFFYTNTLRQLSEMPAPLRWPRQRQEWISCYCCPPNVARLVAGSSRYAYSFDDDKLSVLIYGSSKFEADLQQKGWLKIQQESQYPFDGKVQLTVQSVPIDPFEIRLRIPGWCPTATVSINGEVQPVECNPGTLVELMRQWRSGDRIELELEMPIQLLSAHPLVEECLDQVAVRRGPLIYCLESCDLPDDIGVMQTVLDVEKIGDWRVESGKADLDGISVLRGVIKVETGIANRPQNESTSQLDSTSLYRPYQPPSLREIDTVLVPYFAWGNRQATEMSVWLRKR